MPEPVYLIERFDRVGLYPDQHRCYVLDGCQLLNLAPNMKCLNSTAENLNQLAQLSRMEAKTTLDIFRWALFNALVGNGDAHLKKLLFPIKNSDVVMTPQYDLLSTAIYELPHKHMAHELSQPMGKAQFLGELSETNIVEFAEELLVPASLEAVQVRKMTKAIEQNASRLINVVKNEEQHSGIAGEERLINEIFYNCMKETIANLKL